MAAARLAQVVLSFGVEPAVIRRVGARANTHWRVRSPAGLFFLRRFGDGPDAEASAVWEHDLVHDLAGIGQPVPPAVAPPRRVHGELWLLMRHLPGRKLGSGAVGRDGYRRLGGALAELHDTLDGLAPRGQRPGWCGFPESAFPAHGGAARREELLSDLRAAVPDAARPIEAALAELEARDLPGVFAGVPRHPVHGDFSPWNLLVRRAEVTGLLDWELSHLDVLAADLAFARRGYHDDVVAGYHDHRPMPPAQLAALDGLWLGALFLGLWQTLEGWRRQGRAHPAQLTWILEQFGKVRPYGG
jgi:Ser/Thr protein kinase RdoA (MazF antagonist)